MCGIVAYVGRKIAQPVLIEGLKRLEYRGYDSAGLAVIDADHKLHIRRAVGRISVLEAEIERGNDDGHELPGASIGMAHTRWATHGAATRLNAHPHTDGSGRIALVHNGIIENYAALKKYLQGNGYTFSSETDTEVLAVLVGHLYGELKDEVEGGQKRAAKGRPGRAGRGRGEPTASPSSARTSPRRWSWPARVRR